MRSNRSFAWNERETIIFCPLAHEARVIRRVAGLPKERVIVTGVGVESMRRAVENAPDHIDRALLLGWASGIDARVTPAGIYAIERIVATDGRRLEAPWVVEQIERSTLVSVPEVLRTPDEKHAMAQRTGASLADVEGFTFATEAARRRWKWGMVRAVFDGHDQVYPEGLESVIRPDGRTRIIRSILWAIAIHRTRPEVGAMIENSRVGSAKLAMVAKFVTTPGVEERAR